MHASMHVCKYACMHASSCFHWGINAHKTVVILCCWPLAKRGYYLLESLVELTLLEELQYVGLLRLVVQVCRGDGRAGGRPHGLHDAGRDRRLLLFHGLAHLPFNDALHLSQ